MQKFATALLCLFLSLPMYAQQSNSASAAKSAISQGTLQPRIGISPPRVELALNENGQGAGEFSVLNTGDTKIDIELSVYHWDLDDNNNTRLLAPTEQSLDQWLIINPMRFSIDANNNQTVRFAVRPKVQPEQGEYRAIVYIREIGDDANNEVNFRITYGLPIYANYGEVKRDAVIHQSQLRKQSEALNLQIELSNPGKFYTRPNGAIGIWSSNDYPGDAKADALLEKFNGQIDGTAIATPVFSKPILPSYRRIHNTNIGIDELASGNYIARAYAKIGDKIVQETLRFSQ